jgi:hypothetical protein
MAQGPKGNDDQLYADRKERMGRRVWQADGAVMRSIDRPELFDVSLREVRVKVPSVAGDEFMVVVKGESDEGSVVAFYRAEDYASAVTGAILAWENRSLKWREDRPWSGAG